MEHSSNIEFLTQGENPWTIKVSKCEGGIYGNKTERWWDKLGKPQYAEN